MNLNKLTGSPFGENSLKNICEANLPIFFNPVKSERYCFMLSIEMSYLFLSAILKKHPIILYHVLDI